MSKLPFYFEQLLIRACSEYLIVFRIVRNALWLAAFGCFSFFSMISLYMGVTGAASCGCFGTVKDQFLLAIDLPAESELTTHE